MITTGAGPLTPDRVLVLVLLLAASAISQAPPLVDADGVAAVVNEKVITRFEIEKKMREDGRDLTNVTASERKRFYDSTLLRRVYDIVRETAAKNSGIALSEEELINRRLAKIQEEGFNSEDAFREFLRQSGESEERWNENFRSSQEANAWLSLTTGAYAGRGPNLRPQYSVTATPQEMREFYRKNIKEKFQQKTEANIRVIQLYFRQGVPGERQKALQTVDGLRAKLETKADFGVLAARHSGHPTKDKGGVIERVSPKSDAIPEVVAQVVFNAENAVGSLVGPVEFVNAFWLIQIDSRTDERTIPFEEAQELIRAEIESRKRLRATYAVMLRLVEQAYIHPQTVKSQLEEELRAQLSR